jgi:hypothetical protein
LRAVKLLPIKRTFRRLLLVQYEFAGAPANPVHVGERQIIVRSKPMVNATDDTIVALRVG